MGWAGSSTRWLAKKTAHHVWASAARLISGPPVSFSRWVAILRCMNSCHDDECQVLTQCRRDPTWGRQGDEGTRRWQDLASSFRMESPRRARV
jgi:hypothetical protein